MSQIHLHLPFIMILLFSNFIFSQSPEYQDAYSIANSGISIINNNLWCLENNQAGLALANSTAIGASYYNKYLLKEMGIKSIVVVIPNKFGNLGASVNHFGYNSFNILKGNIAYGCFLSKSMAVGIKIEYASLNASEKMENPHSLNYGGSLNYYFSDKVIAGLGISKLADFTENQESTKKPNIKYLLGFRFQLAKNVFLLTEYEKPPQNPVRIKIATEYEMSQSITINTGISTQPFSFSFGFGIQCRTLLIYTASLYHQQLGFSPAISIQYQF